MGIGAVIVFLAAIAVLALYRANNVPVPVSGYSAYTNNAQVTQAVFSCGAGKTIEAVFMSATSSTTTGNSVQLSLSDGRQLSLPQTISADGGRYADKNEDFVFWTKGTGAFVQENGQTTYDCTLATK